MESAPQPSKLRFSPAEAERFRGRLRVASMMTVGYNSHRSIDRAANCGRDAMVFAEPCGRLTFAKATCETKLCPECCTWWADELRRTLTPTIDKIPAFDIRHIVLTIPNAPRGSLQIRARQLYASFREWRNQGRRKAHGAFWKRVEGYAWKFEVHVSPKSGWHPHLHILAHTPRGFEAGKESPSREAWARITNTHGAPASFRDGLWITAPKQKALALAELAKYAAKPIAIKRMMAEDIAELAESMHRVRYQGSVGTLAHGEPKKPSIGIHYLGNLSRFMNIAMTGEHNGKQATRDERDNAFDILQTAYEFFHRKEDAPEFAKELDPRKRGFGFLVPLQDESEQNNDW